MRYFHHSQADFEFIWTLRVFKALLKYCTPDQILVHLCNIFPPYRNWTVTHGLRRHEGTRFNSAVLATTNLPDREHINLQVFGEADPARSVWDDYNQYRGPQSKGRGRGGRGSGSAFVDNTEPPSEPENSLGIDPVAKPGVIHLLRTKLIPRHHLRVLQKLSLGPNLLSQKQKRNLSNLTLHHLGGRRHLGQLSIRLSQLRLGQSIRLHKHHHLR